MHIITGLGTGGAETMLFKLLCGMNKERYNNIVISLRDGGQFRDKIEELGIRVFSLKMSGLRRILTGIWLLTKYIKKEKPGVIQGWMYHGNLIAAFGRLVAPGNTKLIWNIRASLHDFKSNKRNTALVIRLGALLSFYPKLIIYNSKTSLRQHKQIGYLQSRSRFIPNGFQLDRFQPSFTARQKLREKLNLPGDCILVGLIARYHPVKDFPNFVEAAAILSRKISNVYYLLIGKDADVNNLELKHLIDKFELQHRFHLLGEHAEVSGFIAGLDIATSSSWSESFSNSIGEAMLCAIPCVVTDVGDSADIVGETGKVVPSRNPVELAAGWEALIQLSQTDRNKLGESARNRIIEKYSMEHVVAIYEDMYENMLNQTRAVGSVIPQVNDSH